jgi:hypothetical protein
VAPFYRCEGARRRPVKERSWRLVMDFQCGRYKVEGKGEGVSMERRFDGEGRGESTEHSSAYRWRKLRDQRWKTILVWVELGREAAGTWAGSRNFKRKIR